MLAAQAMPKYWILPNTSKIVTITKETENVYDTL